MSVVSIHSILEERLSWADVGSTPLNGVCIQKPFELHVVKKSKFSQEFELQFNFQNELYMAANSNEVTFKYTVSKN